MAGSNARVVTPMATAHLIVVDGYNVIHRQAALKPGPRRTLAESRSKLVSLLSWAVGGDAHFLVVFDGTEPGPREEGGGRVEVRYSRAPQKADDLIRAVVEEKIGRVERLTVVTSDLEVARHARAMGADLALADLFLGSLLGPSAKPGRGEPEKPTTLSRKELEEWAALFRSRRPAPEEPE